MVLQDLTPCFILKPLGRERRRQRPLDGYLACHVAHHRRDTELTPFDQSLRGAEQCLRVGGDSQFSRNRGMRRDASAKRKLTSR